MTSDRQREGVGREEEGREEGGREEGGKEEGGSEGEKEGERDLGTRG